MTISIRKALANAANAQLSTGPKTNRGKAKSSRNALRHGLTVVLRPTKEASELSRKITSHPDLRPYAEDIAAAHAMLQRIRQFRLDTVRRAYEPMRAKERAGGHFVDAELWGNMYDFGMMTFAIAAVAEQLIKIDGYESRALAARRRAICTFDKVRRSLMINWPEAVSPMEPIMEEKSCKSEPIGDDNHILNWKEIIAKINRGDDGDLQAVLATLNPADYEDKEAFRRAGNDILLKQMKEKVRKISENLSARFRAENEERKRLEVAATNGGGK